MPVDRDARGRLADVIASYMKGEIKTDDFDRAYHEIAGQTEDETLPDLCIDLWLLHDDFVDHPIAVSKGQWDWLLRVLAFLKADLPVETLKRRVKNPNS